MMSGKRKHKPSDYLHLCGDQDSNRTLCGKQPETMAAWKGGQDICFEVTDRADAATCPACIDLVAVGERYYDRHGHAWQYATVFYRDDGEIPPDKWFVEL